MLTVTIVHAQSSTILQSCYRTFNRHILSGQSWKLSNVAVCIIIWSIKDAFWYSCIDSAVEAFLIPFCAHCWTLEGILTMQQGPSSATPPPPTPPSPAVLFPPKVKVQSLFHTTESRRFYSPVTNDKMCWNVTFVFIVPALLQVYFFRSAAFPRHSKSASESLI